ncbi:MAG: D-alanyl-D-alanine carboxypeptidase/D-alanyl-D-alanine-endopeptidase [Gammaproteobacteria bacterium]|nr:MAG: D-alanyl-D-alanine carboxypeptidase/D-alanyl-D-alanine-endopeptidase [Gammaproteobacteria bacterium]
MNQATRWRSSTLGRLLLLNLAFLIVQPVLAEDSQQSASPRIEIPPAVKKVIVGHRLPPDSYSIMVQEVDAPTALLAVNPILPLNPASTMKVLTTLAALEVLGPAYTWKTSVYALGKTENGVLQGDLLIEGGGDPALDENSLRGLLKTLRRIGIKGIAGDLILDADYFDIAVSNGPSIDNKDDRAYNVRPHALLSNFQSVNFYLYPLRGTGKVSIRTDPELPNLNIVNQIRIQQGQCGGYQRGISFKPDPKNPNGVIFSGNYPSSCGEYLLVRAVLDAPNYTYGLFQMLWREQGGEFNGAMRLGAAPAGRRPNLIWPSRPLSDLLKQINKYSNNVMTRHLLLTLGAEAHDAPATPAKGTQAIQDFLHERQIDMTGLVIENGAGLSRNERITTRLMNEVLRRGYRSNFMPEFISTLPLTGIDGTMRNRLRAETTRGRMHIKTGTIDNVSAIAGYVQASSGRYYTVTAILNHELANRGPGVELMDALLRWVYQQ